MLLEWWWGQTTTVITETRGRHGLLPLGATEQAPLVSPVTSEKGIAIEHYLLLLSFPWELTHPAANAKYSGHLVDLPTVHYHFPEPCN